MTLLQECFHSVSNTPPVSGGVFDDDVVWMSGGTFGLKYLQLFQIFELNRFVYI
jgi:hypothetical protein